MNRELLSEVCNRGDGKHIGSDHYEPGSEICIDGWFTVDDLKDIIMALQEQPTPEMLSAAGALEVNVVCPLGCTVSIGPRSATRIYQAMIAARPK